MFNCKIAHQLKPECDTEKDHKDMRDAPGDGIRGYGGRALRQSNHTQGRGQVLDDHGP